MKTAVFGSRKIVAALAALALASLTVAGALPASAVDKVNGPVIPNIDITRTGTLNIHKIEQGSESLVVSPKSQRPAGASGVADVIFTAYNLADLPGLSPAFTNFGAATLTGSNAAWERVELISNALIDGTNEDGDYTVTLSSGPVEFDLSQVQGSVVKSDTTNTDGLVTLSGLPIGAYLIVETGRPANAVAAAAPFVVTVPFPHTEVTVENNEEIVTNAEWLYAFNVFPKNSLTGVTKDVEKPISAEQHLIGSAYTYPVTVKIPYFAEGQTGFKSFVVTDTADPAQITNVVVSGVKIAGEIADAGDFTAAGNVVTLTEQGLKKVNNAQGKNVVVTYTGKIVGFTTEDGAAPNTVEFDFDGTGVSEPLTAEVKNYWGKARLLKVSALDENMKLEGAEFELHLGKKTIADGAVTCEPAVQQDENGDSFIGTYVTNSDGAINFDGLYVGKQGDAILENCYVVVETKAPVGFTFTAGQYIPFKVEPAKNGVITEFTVTNQVFDVLGDVKLPLTGAAGQILLMFGGAAIVALSFGAFLVRRRQQA